MPATAQRAERASAGCDEACRSAYSPEHLGVVALCERQPAPAAPRCRVRPHRGPGRARCAVTSIRREPSLARDLVGRRRERHVGHAATAGRTPPAAIGTWQLAKPPHRDVPAAPPARPRRPRRRASAPRRTRRPSCPAPASRSPARTCRGRQARTLRRDRDGIAPRPAARATCACTVRSATPLDLPRIASANALLPASQRRPDPVRRRARRSSRSRRSALP